MRIAFFGSPDISVPVLDALAKEHEVALAVTRVPKKRGRGSDLLPTPVEQFARDHDIAVSYDPNEAMHAQVELGVIVAFGALIREPLLSAMPLLNLHPSLLPRWRGVAPVEEAILAGDTQTGICVMRIVKDLDAGPIFANAETPINPGSYAHELYESLFQKGSELLLGLLASPLPHPVPQTGEPTYSEKFTRDDFRVNWKDSAELAHRQIRCDRAWTTLNGEMFRIWRGSKTSESGVPGSLKGNVIFASNGGIVLEEVQPANKSRMSFEDWQRGAHIEADQGFV
jgi:methionyl-tRNA formyltransferase